MISWIGKISRSATSNNSWWITSDEKTEIVNNFYNKQLQERGGKRRKEEGKKGKRRERGGKEKEKKRQRKEKEREGRGERKMKRRRRRAGVWCGGVVVWWCGGVVVWWCGVVVWCNTSWKIMSCGHSMPYKHILYYIILVHQSATQRTQHNAHNTQHNQHNTTHNTTNTIQHNHNPTTFLYVAAMFYLHSNTTGALHWLMFVFDGFSVSNFAIVRITSIEITSSRCSIPTKAQTSFITSCLRV
jgi:hypothetical protein